jgi:hypothetical protein
MKKFVQFYRSYNSNQIIIILIIIESEMTRSVKEGHRHNPTNCRPQVAVGRAHCEENWRPLGRKGPRMAPAYRETQRW